MTLCSRSLAFEDSLEVALDEVGDGDQLAVGDPGEHLPGRRRAGSGGSGPAASAEASERRGVSALQRSKRVDGIRCAHSGRSASQHSLDRKFQARFRACFFSRLLRLTRFGRFSQHSFTLARGDVPDEPS